MGDNPSRPGTQKIGQELSDLPNTSATGGFLSPSSPPPPEDDALDAILQACVAGVTGLPGHLVRPRWQPKPPIQPEADIDWCAVGLVDEDPEFNISIVHDGQADGGRGQSISYDNDILTVLSSFYGPCARGYAKRFRTGMMIAQNRETLFHAGIGLVEIPGKSIFLPDIVNTKTLRRVDISMRLRRHTALTWPILNLIGFKGTIVNDDRASTPLRTPHSLNPLKE